MLRAICKKPCKPLDNPHRNYKTALLNCLIKREFNVGNLSTPDKEVLRTEKLLDVKFVTFFSRQVNPIGVDVRRLSKVKALVFHFHLRFTPTVPTLIIFD